MAAQRIRGGRMADDKNYDPEAIAEEVEELENEGLGSVDADDLGRWEQMDDDD